MQHCLSSRPIICLSFLKKIFPTYHLERAKGNKNSEMSEANREIKRDSKITLETSRGTQN